MNRNQRLQRIVSPALGMVVAASLAGAGASPAESGAPWRVGYAEADITPAPGQCFLSGFGRERYARGAFAPLRMQVLSLRDSRGRAGILITADILEFGRTMVEAIRRAVEGKHGIPPSHIIFSASHTHWGPATCFHGSHGVIGAPNVWYLARLEEEILEGIDRALKEQSPATVEYGSFQFRGIGCNRRRPGKNGVAWGPNPEGSFDGHTPVFHIRREVSPGEILVVGHACHPTSSGAIQKWSPDYPGALREALEGDRSRRRALFVQGCGGDAKVVHRDPETGKLVFTADPEGAARAGRKLARGVLDFLGENRRIPLPASISCALSTGEIRFGKRWSREELEREAYSGSRKSWSTWAARQSLAIPDERRSFRYDAQVWKLGGRLTLFAMEGEITSSWGPRLRSLVTGEAMVIGYANSTSAYIPDARIIREGGYEGDVSQRVYALPGLFTGKIEGEVMAVARKALEKVGE